MVACQCSQYVHVCVRVSACMSCAHGTFQLRTSVVVEGLQGTSGGVREGVRAE